MLPCLYPTYGNASFDSYLRVEKVSPESSYTHYGWLGSVWKLSNLGSVSAI